MSNQTDADVIVIGAGPSGSYAAKLLHDQGVRVKLVEAKGSVANMGHGRAASPSWGIRQHWRNAY